MGPINRTVIHIYLNLLAQQLLALRATESGSLIHSKARISTVLKIPKSLPLPVHLAIDTYFVKSIHLTNTWNPCYDKKLCIIRVSA